MKIQTYWNWPAGNKHAGQPDFELNTYSKSAGNQIRSHTSYERLMSFPCPTVVQH